MARIDTKPMISSSVPARLEPLDALLTAVRGCRACEAHLPQAPRPIVQLAAAARILVVGQAPGAHAHASGVPWDDRSGERLRGWMGVEPHEFYDADLVALVPMGLCYPGRSSNGDLPPRRECAPLWHDRLLAQLPQVRLTLLVGQYAQAHGVHGHASVTSTTRDWRLHAPDTLPLPHPSPRNIAWLEVNPWFESELLPVLRERVRRLIDGEVGSAPRA